MSILSRQYCLHTLMGINHDPTNSGYRAERKVEDIRHHTVLGLGAPIALYKYYRLPEAVAGLKEYQVHHQFTMRGTTGEKGPLYKGNSA